MENHTFSVVIEQDEDGMYIATVPSLRGCHTQAKNLDELVKRTKEAIELYLEYQKEKASESIKLQFVGLQQIEVNA